MLKIQEEKEKPNWTKTVNSLFSESRPFTEEEKVMHSNVIKNRSTAKKKLYRL
ncbi:hypothetical protein D3C80_2133860 [compost metagenome]